MCAGLFSSTESGLPFASAEMRVSTSTFFETSFLILSSAPGRIQPLSMKACHSESVQPPPRSSRAARRRALPPRRP